LPADVAKPWADTFFRGNLVKGYLKKSANTAEAFAGGLVPHWRPGVESDGYVKIRTAARTWSVALGRQNVSPAWSRGSAVPASGRHGGCRGRQADDKWGSAVRYVELSRDGARVTEADVGDHCRAQLARFKE
jgi:fatty-acyl-CoA synthase